MLPLTDPHYHIALLVEYLRAEEQQALVVALAQRERLPCGHHRLFQADPGCAACAVRVDTDVAQLALC